MKMNRRRFLTVATTGTITLAGCIGGNIGDKTTEKYEECDLMIIYYGLLPSDVQKEVDTAFNKGKYETEGELLWKEVAGPNVQAIKKDDNFYAPNVEREDGVHTLRFEETTPRYAEPQFLRVSNTTNDTLNISITVKDSKKTILEKADFTVEPKSGLDDHRVPIAREFGEYIFDIEIEGLWSDTIVEELLERYPRPILYIYPDEESSSHGEQVSLAKHVDDVGMRRCTWEGSFE